MLSIIRNSRGQGLVQVLVAAAIGATLMAAIASMQSNQQRENRAMSEKLAANDFQNQMLRSLLDGSVCTNLLTGRTFDSTNAVAGSTNPPSIIINSPTVPVSSDPAAPAMATPGERVSAISNSLRIDAAAANPFRVVDLVGSVNPSNVGTFTGSFQINFDQAQLIRPIKPASTRVILKTSAAGSTQTVTGCTTIMDNTCWVSSPSGLTTVSCGNVGVGTNSPQAPLHVLGPSMRLERDAVTPGSGPAFDYYFNATHFAQIVAVQSGIDGSALSFYTKTAGGNLGAPKVIIDNGGSVGIGTPTPHSTLDVNGYLQIITNSISPPNPADCNQPNHQGRMMIYTPAQDVHRICFCPQNIGGVAFRWWCTPTAVLPP